MVRSPDEVSRDIVATLRLLDPEISAQIGSPERKIIDAVSSVISASYIQSQLVSSVWDIDTKSGVELDEICGLFGFGRREGSRASGVLAFTLNSPAPSDYVIPAGSIVSTATLFDRPPVSYATDVSVVIPAGTVYAEITATCSLDGVVGNTPAQTIIVPDSWSTNLEVQNPSAFINGVDAESDEQLRDRFRKTFLRNLTGTKDFYAALCLNHQNVSKVRVIGPVERHVEQLEVLEGSGGELFFDSAIENSKFAWPKGTVVSANSGLENERYYTDGVAYTVLAQTPQIRFNVVKVDPWDDPFHYYMHKGDIVSVEHEYVSKASRNDPHNQITNMVDIFVNGAEASEITEHTITNLRQLSNPFFAGKEFYDFDGNRVSTGYLQLLSYSPAISLPASIFVDDERYFMATSSDPDGYRLVYEKSVLEGSREMLCGVLFHPNSRPPNGKNISITYTYNKIPMVLDELLRVNKQITTDVLVHEADVVPLGFDLIVQLHKGYDVDQVRVELEESLRDWVETLPYGAWIQHSDIHTVVRQSVGVDNARVNTGLNKGVRVFSKNGRTLVGVEKTDFRLHDNQLASLNVVGIEVRAENTFGR